MADNTPVAVARSSPTRGRVQAQVMEWVHDAAFLSANLFLATKERLDTNAHEIGVSARALHPLAVSCVSTSESTFLLLNSVKPWDAEMLLRSVVEGTAKFLHLSHGTPDERQEKFVEFDIDVPEINRIKRHKRSEEFLSAVPDRDADEWRPLRDLLLSDEELEDLTPRYGAKTRRQIEGRWGFGRIVAEMERIPGHPYAGMRHLVNGYGISSNLLHQDSDGIGIVADRISRDDKRRDAATVAHCARIISDLLVMSQLRAHATGLLTGAPETWLKPLIERSDKLHARMQPARQEFHNVEFGPSE